MIVKKYGCANIGARKSSIIFLLILILVVPTVGSPLDSFELPLLEFQSAYADDDDDDDLTISITSPSNNALLNTVSFTVQGTASGDDLENVKVKVDNGTFQLATGKTSWSFNISGLSNGAHTITAKVTGDDGTAQTTINVTVDTTNPTVVITSPSNNAFLNTATPTVTGTASDSSGMQKVEVKIDNGAFALATGTTSWSFAISSLSDGAHTITVKATDNAGNTAQTTINVTVDTGTPSILITSPSNNAVILTNTFVVTGTASNGPSGIQKVEVKVDSSSFQLATGTTSWSFAISSLSDGAHTITVKATDNAGNVSTTSASITVTTTRSAAINTVTQSGVTTIGVDEASNGAIDQNSIRSVDAKSVNAEGPPPVDFPHGLLEFTALCVSPGCTITITITFPSDIPAGAEYWKVQAGIWVKLPNDRVGSNDGDRTLTITLTDGGTGDADGLANGVIVDPGGPGISAASASGGSCDGRIVITNDPKVGGQCVILDLEPPKLTSALVTVNGFFCVKGIDNTGIAKVKANGNEVNPWQGVGNTFCAEEVVNLGDAVYISAEDIAGNKAGAFILANTKTTETTQEFASYIDKEHNPHTAIEGIVIENRSDKPLEQVRLMLSPDMDRGRFLLSEYAFRQIDEIQKVTIRMNTNNTEAFSGHLIVAAANSGILTVFPIEVEQSDFHILTPTIKQKRPTTYLDLMSAGSLVPSIPLNALQKAEFDGALQAIAEGGSLTLAQHRILQYAVVPDNLKIKHNTHHYEVWVNNDEEAITAVTGSITIKNTSDRSMNNVRIKVEISSKILMFEEYVIKEIPVGEEVTINFKPIIPENKMLERNYFGNVIIAPSDHRPVQIPIAVRLPI